MTTFQQIIEFAIVKEQEAYNFYADLALIVKNPASKAMIEEFKLMELEHCKILQSITPSTLQKFNSDEIGKMELSNYFVETVPNKEMLYQDLITLAMKREIDSYKLYMDMSNATADMEAKLFFITLADQEIKHKLKLETIYDDNIYKEN
jgi:rubrerythrin